MTWNEALACLKPVARRLPAYTRLGWALFRDVQMKPRSKGRMLAALAYLLSPIDLVPGAVPVLGQLDDLLVLLWGVAGVLRALSPQQRQRHLDRYGLTMEIVKSDLATVRAVNRALWREAGTRAGAGIGRLGRGALNLAGRVANKLPKR